MRASSRLVMVRPILALAEFVVMTVRPVAVKQQRGVVVPATLVPLPIRSPTARYDSRLERTFSPERPCAVSGPGGAELEDDVAPARTHPSPRQGGPPGRLRRANSMPDPTSNLWARRAQTEPVQPDRMTVRHSARRGFPGPADAASGLRGRDGVRHRAIISRAPVLRPLIGMSGHPWALKSAGSAHLDGAAVMSCRPSRSAALRTPCRHSV
jgi:hypothetical protein